MDPLLVVGDVLDELNRAPRVDILTYSGSGEPTLSSDLGWLMKETKRETGLPIALITNGSLFFDEKVREEAARADIVLPSLDAASEEAFQAVNRPHPALKLRSIIEGLEAFRHQFKGEMWLEVMVVKGFNDSMENLIRLRDSIGRIRPDRVQINTVTRPPAYDDARRLDQAELRRVTEILGERAKVICHFDKTLFGSKTAEWQSAVFDVLARRSLTVRDMVRVTGMSESRLRGYLRHLEGIGAVSKKRVGRSVFYVVSDDLPEGPIRVDKSPEQHLV